MPAIAAQKARPKYLSLGAILFHIRLPLAAWVSILHRISGVLLFAAGVWLLYLLDLSLASETGFAKAKEVLAQPLPKLTALVLLWAFCHHFFAGIRFLLLDLDIGAEKQAARLSGGVALTSGIFAAALIGWKLW